MRLQHPFAGPFILSAAAHQVMLERGSLVNALALRFLIHAVGLTMLRRAAPTVSVDSKWALKVRTVRLDRPAVLATGRAVNRGVRRTTRSGARRNAADTRWAGLCR